LFYDEWGVWEDSDCSVPYNELGVFDDVPVSSPFVRGRPDDGIDLFDPYVQERLGIGEFGECLEGCGGLVGRVSGV